MTADIADSGDDQTTETGLEPGQLDRTDHGRLPEMTRRVLVQLLRGPYVRQENHPKLWAALVCDEEPVRIALSNLFLELVIDAEQNLAFVRNVEYAAIDTPRVIRSTPLTLLDTALVLHLRQLLLRGTDATGRVFIGREDIDDALSPFRPATNTDPATFAKRINSAVDKMKRSSVLLTTSESERFEISPILAIVFDANEVTAVTREVQALRQEVATRSTARYAATDPDPEPDEVDTEDSALVDLEGSEAPRTTPRRAAEEDL